MKDGEFGLKGSGQQQVTDFMIFEFDDTRWRIRRRGRRDLDPRSLPSVATEHGIALSADLRNQPPPHPEWHECSSPNQPKLQDAGPVYSSVSSPDRSCHTSATTAAAVLRYNTSLLDPPVKQIARGTKAIVALTAHSLPDFSPLTKFGESFCDSHARVRCHQRRNVIKKRLGLDQLERPPVNIALLFRLCERAEVPL